ncbi:MAG TPA: bifunctional diguanylate cyclase/phosphodiesterase [Allosphingosinicella sp.]|nr:bifunctional diguanylate cyclase/phosphodiesterase [Allosphingosinicella sp.]
MQAAKGRGRGKPAAGGVPPPSGVPPELAPQFHSVLEAVRQRYLDALPIASAILTIEGDVFIECANDPFRLLAEWDERLGERRIAEVPMLRSGPIGSRLAAFLKGEDAAVQFDTTDGRAIAGRHFTVRFARLTLLPGQPSRCMVSLLDKTAQVETERSLRAEMLRDSLTGLPNRTAFNEQVEAVLEDPGFQPGSHAVLVVDMRRFSRVNECVGSLAGDELLITFARRLYSALRAGDLLARTGGDEFGILMRLDRGLEEALQAAARIEASLASPFRLSELEIRVDCALGCALLSGSEALAEEVLRNAQFALKRSKASGDVQIYEPNQARAARRRFSIETELRRSIEAGGLTLAYQPLIDLCTGAVAGFEALARWDHPRRGPISPSEFIPVAEESGLIVPLGQWALETALATLASWDRAAGAALPFSVSVNLSALQLARDDLVGFVAAALERHGLAGSRLTLELTESAIVQDPRRATTVLDGLKALEARVAMDDFGTGYTSLAYLQRLPIDMLKIDRSFVAGMLRDSDSVAIVRAILSLASALGMATTAEGIETPELAEALAGMGCSHGQGYQFSRPLAADQAYAYWRSRSA